MKRNLSSAFNPSYIHIHILGAVGSNVRPGTNSSSSASAFLVRGTDWSINPNKHVFDDVDDGGRKPEHPEETHADTGRTCKLHTERFGTVLNSRPSSCEAAVLTTVPPNLCKSFVHVYKRFVSVLL